jgi:hypothetical protein
VRYYNAFCYISPRNKTSRLEGIVDMQYIFRVRGQLNCQTHVSCSNWQHWLAVRVRSHDYIIKSFMSGSQWNCRSRWPRGQSWIVFARSNAGIVGSNPTRCLDICVFLFFVCVVLCVGSGLSTGWSPVQGVQPTVYKIKKLKKRPRSNVRTVEP